MFSENVLSDVKPLYKSKYYNRKAKDTIRRMQSKTGLIVEGSILRSLEEQGFSFDVALDNKSVYDPEEIFIQLGRYAGKSRPKFDSYRLKQVTDLAFRVFGNKEAVLSPLSKVRDLRSAIKEEKSSGAPEFMRKEDTFERDLERALKIANNKRAADPCVAFHRVQHGDAGPKTRLVWGYPQSMTILESIFARPLIDRFKNERSPMAFGLRKHELAARMTPIENSGVRFSFDFSKFDSSIPARLIQIAFDVLATHFEFDTKHKRTWEKVIHYFIHTPILMPDGNIYQKHHGVPSGSYFTQMVDSIVNYMVIQYAMLEATGEAVFDDKILVLGDDSLIGHRHHLPLKAMSSILAPLGFNLSVEKSQVSKYPHNVEFLGHDWFRGIVDREPRSIAIRMAFPETRSGIKDPRLRISSRMLAYVNDARSAHAIYNAWCRYSGPNIVRLYTRERSLNPVTGWEQFMTGVHDVTLDKPLVSAYRGILL